MAVDAGEVDFFDLAALELRLHEFGEMPRAGENDKPAGVGVEPVRGPGFQRMAGRVKDGEEGVAVEAPAWVDRQRRGLIDHNQGLVLVEDADGGVDLRLDVGGSFSQVAFCGADAVAGRNRHARGGEDLVFLENPEPFGGFGVGKNRAEGFQM